jgi:hypothetical protein
MRQSNKSKQPRPIGVMTLIYPQNLMTFNNVLCVCHQKCIITNLIYNIDDVFLDILLRCDAKVILPLSLTCKDS